MRQKLLALLLTIALLSILSFLPAFAEGSLAMMVAPSQFAPGGTLHVYFTLQKTEVVDLVVLDKNGTVRATLLSEAKVPSGAHDFTWDGKEKGEALAEGKYVLRLSVDSMSVDMDVTIIESLPDTQASFYVEPQVMDREADGVVTVFQTENTPEPSQEPNAKTVMTPAYKSVHTPSPAHEACYWCTPMDIRDEEAVWAMLIAPVTVVKGGQKEQVILREEPSDDSKGVGVVTCDSQSVHVLENRDDGWSLVECYSSSFYDSKVKAWNLFVSGYIRTNKLTTKTPVTDYGMVIDKLTQELYLFKEGRLFSKLLISTGLYNDKQPYNETRSGEFLIVSRVGEFRSDNMYASMALRFNSGDLLHEVPHVKNADGTKNFKNTEYKLGTRASHGCIRTQQIKNAESINMTWLWNNITVNTKMVIWEDYAGRLMEIPSSALTLYYNPDGGSNYHSAEECRGVKSAFLPFQGKFTYGELEDDPYTKLTPCSYCSPPRRIEDIREINTIHETQSPGEVPQHLRQDK